MKGKTEGGQPETVLRDLIKRFGGDPPTIEEIVRNATNIEFCLLGDSLGVEFNLNPEDLSVQRRVTLSPHNTVTIDTWVAQRGRWKDINVSVLRRVREVRVDSSMGAIVFYGEGDSTLRIMTRAAGVSYWSGREEPFGGRVSRMLSRLLR